MRLISYPRLDQIDNSIQVVNSRSVFFLFFGPVWQHGRFSRRGMSTTFAPCGVPVPVAIHCQSRKKKKKEVERECHLVAMIGGGAGIGDQVAGDDRVDEDEDDQGQQEEEANGGDVVENRPEGVGLRHAAGRR